MTPELWRALVGLVAHLRPCVVAWSEETAVVFDRLIRECNATINGTCDPSETLDAAHRAAGLRDQLHGAYEYLAAFDALDALSALADTLALMDAPALSAELRFGMDLTSHARAVFEIVQRMVGAGECAAVLAEHLPWPVDVELLAVLLADGSPLPVSVEAARLLVA